MDTATKNEWLAELLLSRRDLVTEYWIEEIRAEEIPGYQAINDEQLRQHLPPTVDSMIYAFQTGDTDSPRRHSVGVIQQRLADGFLLPDLQMSLHALETAVMRIVLEANLGPVKEYEALRSASLMYYTVALIAAVVYERLRAEQQRRFTTVYELGTTLSRTLDMHAVLDIAVRKVAEYTDAGSVSILLTRPEDNEYEVRACHNLSPDLAGAMPGICKAIGCGAVEGIAADNIDAHMRQSACAVPDIRANERLDKWSGLLASRRILSMVCVPLLAKQRRLGLLAILWHDAHIVAEAELDYLLAMGGHIANAVQNAFLYDEAKGKRELDVLLKASRLFASSLDTQDILRKIANMAAEAIGADLGLVFTLDRMKDRSGGIAYYARNRGGEDMISRMVKVLAPKWEEACLSSFGQTFANGEPLLFGSPAEFPEILRPIVGATGSGLAVPLRQKNALIGAFTLMSLEQNAFTKDDLPLAMGLADLAAVAVENSQLYQYERNIAEILQRSFLPSILPSIDGYEDGAFYRPAMAEARVGGDFYDLFITADGKANFVIGDVSGKGLKAAVPTAMGKYMIRAYAVEDASPSNVLARFNRIFCEDAPEDMFMTAFYGILDPNNHTLTYANAGHNPPLFYSRSSGRIEQLIAAGTSLGIIADVSYVDSSIRFQPGDVLLLYTDGATDVKGESSRLELEGLEQLFLSNARAPAQQIANNISDGIWHYGHGKLPDDVALVVLKRCEPV